MKKTGWTLTVAAWVLGWTLLQGLAADTTEGSPWMTDFEAAKAKAIELKRPILIDFSGSDWCGWCIKLDKEVFQKKPFKQFAEKKLVLFLADFPRSVKQDDGLKKQNKALAAQYRVEGYPTVLLLDAQGQVLARTGYQKGGAEAYVKHLEQLLTPPAGK